MSQQSIEVELSAPARVPVGEAVPVSIAVRNLTGAPLWMVGVLPGAEAGQRLPRYLPRVISEGQVVAAPAMGQRVAPLPPLRLVDFHRLAPGEAVDPTESRTHGGWMPLQTFLHFRPKRRGSHVFVVTLSTAAEGERWLGAVDLADDAQELQARVSAIPRIVVESNRLEVIAI
jgi:hypothetical protein